MRGEFNGLKALILRENECAFYIHCFAHQLQLALVAIAKNHIEITGFFTIATNVANIIGASSKRRDILRDRCNVAMLEDLSTNELSTGKGLNQETNLKPPSDTRWGSHYSTLVSFITMFASIEDVLETIVDNGSNSEQKYEAKILMSSIHSFDFVFNLHLMKNVLGVTNELSQTLQRKDKDIVNAMNLVRICKERLQVMRETGWKSLFDQVGVFCEKHDIQVPQMDDIFFNGGRQRRKTQKVTNMHHYRVGIFYTVIDMQLQESNSRFTETSTESLLCVSCLNPNDSFAAFEKEKLIRFAQYYPRDFSIIDPAILEDQLENYIIDMRSDAKFVGVKEYQ